jgi:hypothetical protein
MHLPTYLGLMIIATIYDLSQLVVSWYTNQILLFASFMVLIITWVVGFAQLSDEDSFQFRLMLFYSIPVGILLFGQLAGLHELENHLLQSVKLPSLPSIIPGISRDYQSAAENHYISMLFPLLAKVVAWATQILLSFVAKHKANNQ